MTNTKSKKHTSGLTRTARKYLPNPTLNRYRQSLPIPPLTSQANVLTIYT